MRLTKICGGPVSDTEKLLMCWIEDQTQKYIPLSTRKITAKAKCLLVILKEKAGPDSEVDFTANSGWCKGPADCYSFHNMKVSAESVVLM